MAIQPTQQFSAGQLPDPNMCLACRNVFPTELIKKCGRCLSAIYCGQECQRKDWPNHKKICSPASSSSSTEKAQTVAQTKVIINNPATPPNHPIYQSVDNEEIRKNFSKACTDKNSLHVLATRQCILQGSNHLNPETSVVTVFGAQFFNREFVEPLPELLKKCKKMILIDIDPVTLKQLKQMLNDPKVVTIETDLSNSSRNRVFALIDEARTQKWNIKYTIKRFMSLLEEIMQEMKTTQFDLAAPLKEAKNSDYVISSLVSSELFSGLKRIFFTGCLELFGKNYRNLMEVHYNPKDIQNIFNQAMNAYVESHIKTLEACTGSSGTIYYADTQLLNNVPLIEFNFLSETIEKLREERPDIQSSNWLWKSNEDNTYKVLAFLIQKMQQAD